MQIHLRVRRWVMWWFYVGVVCGGVAVANILGRDLTRSQERILLIVGALHWLLGGIVCWAFESVRFRQSPAPRKPQTAVKNPLRDTEWHPASDFLLPGRRQSLLPSSVAFSRRRRAVPDSLRASDARPQR